MRKLLVFLLAVALLVAWPFKVSWAKSKTITIAVIDTGIDKALPNLCKMGHKSFVADEVDPLNDLHGHGTHIAGLINENAGEGNYCLVAIKYYSERANGTQNLENLKKAINYAINIKVDFINISGGGPEADANERAAIERALNKKIKVVVAAGNEHSDLDKSCNYFPACYDPRLTVVGNLQITKDHRNLPADLIAAAWAAKLEIAKKIGSFDTERSPTSNYGIKVTRWEIGTNIKSTLPNGETGYMTGTSQATAIATGKLVHQVLAK